MLLELTFFSSFAAAAAGELAAALAVVAMAVGAGGELAAA